MRLILYYNYKNPFIDYNAVINEITKLTCLYVYQIVIIGERIIQ